MQNLLQVNIAFRQTIISKNVWKKYPDNKKTEPNQNVDGS
jgi:hypothetical protein